MTEMVNYIPECICGECKREWLANHWICAGWVSMRKLERELGRDRSETIRQEQLRCTSVIHASPYMQEHGYGIDSPPPKLRPSKSGRELLYRGSPLVSPSCAVAAEPELVVSLVAASRFLKPIYY